MLYLSAMYEDTFDGSLLETADVSIKKKTITLKFYAGSRMGDHLEYPLTYFAEEIQNGRFEPIKDFS